MPLTPGTRLGPYEIVAPLGAGGMGEVYRARDTRLDRAVAIKVLPQDPAVTSEARARFEREARIISRLNHPHICALYDLGHQDDVDFLVMEYLDGETLGARLRRGRLPTDQVLRFAIEIADALNAAHRKGVVHRDLKPRNIMLAESGAKLLDFGIAKLRDSRHVGASVDQSSTKTLTRDLTPDGAIIGTPQYMAPEQLLGKDIDARADLFSFGTVLYETITGRRAFQGHNSSSVIEAILNSHPPPMSLLAPNTPPALERIVETCLAKEPDDRWQTARDLLRQLEWVNETDSAAKKVHAGRQRLVTRRRLGYIVVVVLGVGAAILSPRIRGRPGESETRFSVRAHILPTEGTSLKPVTSGGVPAISPDGRYLVFIAETARGKNSLWLRPLSSMEARPLAGTEGASHPFWSPDSRSIGFFASQSLKRVEAKGGPVATVCEAPSGRGGSWNRNGVIIFANRFGPIRRVSSSGGESVAATTINSAAHELTHRWPQFLPDGERFLYLSSSYGSADPGNTILLAGLDGRLISRLLSLSSNVTYARSHLFYARGHSLMAQPFDVTSARLSGEPFQVAQDVLYDPLTSGAMFSVSAEGTLAYLSGAALPLSQLTWFDRSGQSLGTLRGAHSYMSIRLSPDGQRVAASIYDATTANEDVWLWDMDSGANTRLTFDAARDTWPVWSPDGREVVFASSRSGYIDLYKKASSGAGAEEVMMTTGALESPCDWSSDGRFLCFRRDDLKDGSEWALWILPTSGEPKAYRLRQSKSNQWGGRFSPDGRWLAYTSDEPGQSEVFVVAVPPRDGIWQVSAKGGHSPRWRRDGREIFYTSPDMQLMAVSVDLGSTPTVGTAHELFTLRVPDVGGDYDVSADGQRILVNVLLAEQTTPFILVTNCLSGPDM